MRRWNPKKICGLDAFSSVLAALCGVLLLSACSNDKHDVAGGTEAESTIVALQIQVAGNHAYSRVRALPDDFLAEEATEAEWIETDENGFVKIPMEPGAYTVEARHVDGAVATGAVYSVAIDSSSSDVIDTIKLVELSSIEGFVLLGESTPVIRIAGLDRYVVPDSMGHFVIDSLPTGSFEILFGDPQEINSTKVESTTGDTLYVDCSDSVVQVTGPVESAATEVPKGDWNEHAALLAQVDGYAVGILGAAGITDSLGNISAAEGEICVVTTTEDYVIVEDTTEVDSAGNAKTTAVIAPGSLRECAYKEGPTWILFEKDGVYDLQSPLRLKSDKTFDGRGRNIQISGMGILTSESSNLIFENLTFTKPAITALDTSSRRALSIHSRTHHVWVDHCKFEEYPLVELDVKRGSHHVTISWSRFENAQTGVLFGLAGDIIMDTAQSLTMHHNYFAGLSRDGILAHGGKLHAYNNFFDSVEKAGVVCSDSAYCLVEKNVFNNEMPVTLYRWYNEDGSPVDSTVGFVNMVDNKLVAEEGFVEGDARGYKPDYKYSADDVDVGLALLLKSQSGAR